ncbi:MAG: hypothetical protein A2W80_13355 [Candidatus Riflebacteria bacterium GWC2_50_8]|nr:MAG: hypothetical protein A2W80_13355 [Candidatus Riflebacteria bacterium GWC2_50_8]
MINYSSYMWPGQFRIEEFRPASNEKSKIYKFSQKKAERSHAELQEHSRSWWFWLFALMLAAYNSFLSAP